ncbi:hypothetical protein H2199_004570 [Coniosporium tulheliwenetii]|uniref:Uncharacterized protein n=1 Tax=Coniosporium tulheliwenetii TaxID=3383036 RepID=A0ACC2Z5U9_9PEZI|nr:hypothetical protein H2199_004570 [Cladosporium sp. JES 115]
MSRPLPITLHGPVTVLSPSVRATGVNKGAKVTIYDGAAEVGSGVSDIDGEYLVPLETSLLVERHLLKGVQTTAGGTSSQTDYGVEVTGVDLEAPVLASTLHTCMTDILVDGLTPGATLITTIDGDRFGESAVLSPLSWCGIDREKDISADATVTIHQEATINGAAAIGPSPNCPKCSAFAYPHDKLLPGLLMSPIECDTNRSFTDMVPGAITEIQNEGQWEIWLNPTNTFTGFGGLSLKKGSIQMVQKLPRCKREGAPWDGVVKPLDALPAPVVAHSLCRELRRLTISQLLPTGTLSLWRMINTHGGSVIGEQIGYHPFSSTTETVDLPPDLQLDDPQGVVSISVRQSRCGIQSPEILVPVASGSSVVGPPKFTADLYECGRWIPLANLNPGSNIQAFDSRGPISDPFLAQKSVMSLKTWRRLRQGQLYVVETGCRTDHKIVTDVLPLPNPLPTPKITAPLRPGFQYVRLEGVLTGASVYVLVNGKIQSAPVEMADPTVGIIWLRNALNDKDRVTAVQMLCEHALNTEGKRIHAGVTGKHQISWNTHTSILPATISINGLVLGSAGQPLHYSPRLGDPNPRGIVSAGPAYIDAEFTISLDDPVRNWNLNLRAQWCPTSFTTITNWTVIIDITELNWNVVPRWNPSAARSIRVRPDNPAIPTFSSISVLLPIPTGSERRLDVTISGSTDPRDPSVSAATIPAIAAVYEHTGNNNGLISFNLTTPFVFDSVTGDLVYWVVPEYAGAS